MPTLVVKKPDGSQAEVSVQNELTVGRAEDNGLILSEGGVSRKHARFFLQEGGLFLEDLGSSNGSFVDGVKISSPTAVPPGGEVVIGAYKVLLKGDDIPQIAPLL